MLHTAFLIVMCLIAGFAAAIGVLLAYTHYFDRPSR